MPPSPSPEYKHFCRVCNKGFTCGSALGGHMRAHGASDVDAFAAADDVSLGDERPATAGARSSADVDQWVDAAAGTSAAATHAYALRANPNRLIRSCQVCKNCGKEFTSWELFLEHGKCNSDDDEDDGSPRSSSPPLSDGEDDPAVAAAAGWSKGKRSRRVNKLITAGDDVVPAASPSSRRCAASGEEEEDLANCLVMLSSSNVEQSAAAATVAGTTSHRQEPSASMERDRGPPPQLLQPISFLAPAPEPVMALPSAAAATQYASPAPRGMFECKACKKVFTSHQALGGHRASHKKVKGCFAARFDSNVSETPTSHAAATADLNNDNGKAAAVESSMHAAAADANKSSLHTSTDGDTNVGTSEAATALSMSLAQPAEPSPPVAAFPVVAAPSKKNTKMHECSVCHRLFTSGQALGGHKRCHWLTSSTADPANPVAPLAIPPLTEDLVGVVRHQLMLRPLADPPEPALDLTIAHPAARAADQQPGGGSFHLDAPPPPVLHFQSPVVLDSASLRNKTSTTSGHDGATASAAAAEDEADSTVVKRARLSDLKAVVSMDGEAPEPWLKVGIGSSSAGGDDDKNARE